MNPSLNALFLFQTIIILLHLIITPVDDTYVLTIFKELARIFS